MKRCRARTSLTAAAVALIVRQAQAFTSTIPNHLCPQRREGAAPRGRAASPKRSVLALSSSDWVGVLPGSLGEEEQQEKREEKRVEARRGPNAVRVAHREFTDFSELKTGLCLQGSIVDVQPYAVFVDCGIKRSRKKGSAVKCNGFLHHAELRRGSQLTEAEKAEGKKAPNKQQLEKGAHVTVYVKDVFPNSGRYTLTLDASVTPKKVKEVRQEHRQVVKKERRARRLQTSVNLADLQDGQSIEGVVARVSLGNLLVDIGAVPLFKVPKESVLAALGAQEEAEEGMEGEGSNLHMAVQAGAKVRVQVVKTSLPPDPASGHSRPRSRLSLAFLGMAEKGEKEDGQGAED